MSPEETAGKYLVGEFVNVEKPVFRGNTVYTPSTCGCGGKEAK